MNEPSTGKRLSYRGDLSDQALPEIFFKVYRHQVPGVIEATREGSTKRVYLRAGAVVHATSTDRADSLGEHLLGSGVITRDDFERATRMRDGSERRFGEILIELGVLTPKELHAAIKAHMESIVWSLFSWNSGEVFFELGEFEDNDMIRLHIPMRGVILEGIKRVPDARALVGRLGRKETVFAPIFTTEELIEIALDGEELSLLQLVDGKRRLFDLCSEGPFSPAENARFLYAYQVLQLIQRVGSNNPASGGVKLRMSQRV